ncbi:hypothetical protein AAHC03_025982 [Spirometra sp. Aus1]
MILLSKQLSLPCVENWAVDFLSVRLQNDNLSESWNFATAVNCEGLRDACVHHMKAFFEAVVASDLLLELPADVLLSVLRDDDLQVSSEKTVFEAIKRWVCPSGTVDEERIVHAPEMLREVRWSQTKQHFRRRLMESDDLIVSSADCMQCVGLADHWIGYSMLGTQEECPFNDSPRPASLAASIIVFGESAAENRCLICQYDFQENTCEELGTMEGLWGAKFVSFGESVFVIGGRVSGQISTSLRVDEFRTRERQWRRRPDLQIRREYHAATVVAVGEHQEDALVFVCGGSYSLDDSASVEFLRSSRCPSALLVYKGRLYALGDGNTVEEFVPEGPPTTAEDLSSWSWAELEPLNDLNAIYGAVVI